VATQFGVANPKENATTKASHSTASRLANAMSDLTSHVTSVCRRKPNQQLANQRAVQDTGQLELENTSHA